MTLPTGHRQYTQVHCSGQKGLGAFAHFGKTLFEARVPLENRTVTR